MRKNILFIGECCYVYDDNGIKGYIISHPYNIKIIMKDKSEDYKITAVQYYIKNIFFFQNI